MSWDTAEETVSVRFNSPSLRISAFHDVPIKQDMPTPQLSDMKPEADIREVHPISATWFAAVQRRILNSIAPLGRAIDDDGRWLSQNIADAASTFFKATSDVLPSEPFIYSSRKGDLVAEYSVAHGTMTNIVTQASVIVFAVVDGVPIEKQLALGGSATDTLREELQRLTTMLHTGRHGAQVESQN